MLAWFAEASEGDYVFPGITGATNLRTQLEKIIARAGVKQWPKLWQNLRASGATDFARSLPSHVAAAICGHTEQIAQEHYWQVTDSDMAEALQKLTPKPEVTKSLETNAFIVEEWTILDSNESEIPRKNHSLSLTGYSSGYSSKLPSSESILALWNLLDDVARQDLLRLAKSKVEKSQTRDLSPEKTPPGTAVSKNGDFQPGASTNGATF